MTISTTKKEYYGGIKELIKRAKKLNTSIKVGVIKGTGTHPNSNGATIAEIAAMNEFGTFEETVEAIPARPFLRTALDENKDKYVKTQKAGLLAASLGIITPTKMLSILGMQAKSDIQKKIRSNDFQENAPSTIDAKGGKSKPLIDTGILRQSIDWVIEEDEE